MTHLAIAAGARWQLSAILDEVRPSRTLVVASSRAQRTSNVREMLHGYDVEWFSEFTPNPTADQVLAGASVRAEVDPDLIVAVGGGSAIDAAKLIRVTPADRDQARELLAGRRALSAGRRRPAVVAIPTTAGSGSEVTRFATFYLGLVKRSLDDPVIAPDWALVDPELLRTCPPQVMYSSAFDTFCHAVESYWSRRATARSRALAGAALQRLAGALAHDLRQAGEPERASLATAATLGGQAIDLTRTTAAHAFSYGLTARFGVPHGVACLLNMLWLIDHNFADSEAAAELGPVLDCLRALNANRRPARPSDTIRAMLAAAGVPSRLRHYGVRADDLPDLVDAGLASDRAGNNPTAVDREFASRQLSSLL